MSPLLKASLYIKWRRNLYTVASYPSGHTGLKRRFNIASMSRMLNQRYNDVVSTVYACWLYILYVYTNRGETLILSFQETTSVSTDIDVTLHGVTFFYF